MAHFIRRPQLARERHQREDFRDVRIVMAVAIPPHVAVFRRQRAGRVPASASRHLYSTGEELERTISEIREIVEKQHWATNKHE